MEIVKKQMTLHHTVSVIGGFMAGYTIINHSDILANAQTGNLIRLVLSAFEQNVYVQYAFRGIRAGVIAMVFKALWTMAKKCPKHWWSYGIAALAFVLSAFADVHILIIIALCAVLGLVASFVQDRRVQK